MSVSFHHHTPSSLPTCPIFGVDLPMCCVHFAEDRYSLKVARFDLEGMEVDPAVRKGGTVVCGIGDSSPL